MKIKTLLLSVLLFGTSAIAQIPTAALVAYYPFSGNATDASGNGNNGTVDNASLTADRFGDANSAYSFNGTNDSIEVPNSSSLQFSSSQSISFWMNFPAFPSSSNYNENGILSKINENLGIDPTGASTQGFKIRFSNSIANGMNVAYSVKSGNTSGWANSFINNTLLSTNTWEHIVFIFNSNTDSTYAYLNGALVNQALIPSGTTIGQNAMPLVIGWENWNDNGYPANLYDGVLDDIRIYNTALTSANVTALYGESICYQSVTVTDTLVIHENITGYNPITYANTIKIYPNPTNTSITIDAGINGSNNGYTVKILNSLSQVVYQQTIANTSYTVNLSTLGSQGVYFLQLYNLSGNLIDVRKIVLE